MELFIVLGLVLLHYLGDFTRFRIREDSSIKVSLDSGFPRITHVMIHGLLALGFLTFYSLSFWKYLLVFIMITVTHFFLDYGKGLLQNRYGVLTDPKNEWYWRFFALGQSLHISVILLIVHLISV